MMPLRCLLSLVLLIALPASAAPLTVFAAASLQESLEAVAAAWEAQGGSEVRVSYAASSTLARQIEEGAPADVFFSADLDWMNYLHVRGKIDGESRRDLLGNRLVLIAPKASGTPPVTFDLRAPLPRPLPLGANERIALALTASVPAGKYAKAALTRLALWEPLAAQVVEAENVRAALQLVARGEAQMGVVYRSDARVEPRVKVLGELPFGSHPRIVYPAARVAASPHAEANGFIAFLQSDAAKALFRERGFTPLD